MKKVFCAAILLMATTAIPAQAAPNRCDTLRSGQYSGQYACLFYPAADGSTLYVFPSSIEIVKNALVLFSYIGSSGLKRPAQVDCNSARDHWHAFIEDGSVRKIDVTSNASRRMLDYVCAEAGFGS